MTTEEIYRFLAKEAPGMETTKVFELLFLALFERLDQIEQRLRR